MEKIDEIIKVNDSNFKYQNEILDLKKENLLLVQQNIEKDKKIAELEKEINNKLLQYKESTIKAVSEMRNRLVDKIDNKIDMLDISDRKQLYTENILYELRREI